MGLNGMLPTVVCLSLLATIHAMGVPHSRGIMTERMSPFASCRGSATYDVTFVNFLTSGVFGSLIPESGLNFSPLTATGHSNRVSILTVRGFASPAIEQVAETGSNAMLVEMLKKLRAAKYVRSYAAASNITTPGSFTTLRVKVDCMNPFISAVSMIAPSPDWIVQINNINTVDGSRFITSRSGFLIAYDAGVDDGRDFTDPADPSLDMPTVPPKNIAPLVEDETDRFKGRRVGFYMVRRVYRTRKASMKN